MDPEEARMARAALALTLCLVAVRVEAQTQTTDAASAMPPVVTEQPANAPVVSEQTANPPAADSTVAPFADVEVIGTPVAVVRAGPGPEHAIVATVGEGTVLTVDARTGAWYHVRLGDAASGWMHESLLKQYVDPRKFEFVPDRGRPSRQRSFHFVAYGGNYAADREDNGLLFGARIGYSVTRRFAFEAGAGYTRVVRT